MTGGGASNGPVAAGRDGASDRPARPGRAELGLLLAILALAAVLRLPGLDARGAWDSDQGTEMLALQAMVSDGQIPLLGPSFSIGNVHHGAVYYYLLAPAAAISGADPVAVTGEIALFGIGAVAATWWLARLLAGSLAALAAALLAAVSPAGIIGSTFIWNPNPIPFAAGVAYAAALHAWRSHRPRWWLVSALGAMVAMQCHLLAVIALPPLVVAFVADARRRRGAGDALGPLLRAGAGGLAIIAAGFLPLAISELGHDFAETRAIIDYLAGGGSATAGSGTTIGFVPTVALVAVRALTWPLAGLLTDHVAGALVAALAVTLLGAVALAGERREGRWASWWLLATLVWSVLALAIVAPGLATVTPGLPNDHYHAFLDPLVLAVTGAGIARLATLHATRAGPGPAVSGSGRQGRRAPFGRLSPPFGRLAPLAAGLAALLVVVEVAAWPPAVSPDGGWAQADQTAAATIEAVGDRPFALDSIPSFKPADALRFPLERRGVVPLPAAALAAADPPRAAVVVCDPLFDEADGLACGGPAESDWQARAAPGLALAGRWQAGSRRVISVYLAP